ncbi:hypothetical protein M9Y10_002149 [Tritrichomonas musculus]|uniref:Ubiquitin-like domain-containing protein n=1 Tax=Tritrichomonas musculus TaxID=1915356 RepID=A0ABR2L900_9EUKA
MIIKFLHTNGTTFTLDMNDDATIQQTKIALVYLYKLPYKSLEFLINGRTLNDNEIISQIGYLGDGYIIFYEPVPSEDIEGISPFFGSIPQICNTLGAPPFSDKDTMRRNTPQQNTEKINPFKDIENGSDRKYLKYIIEPSLIQEKKDSSIDFNPISIDGNEIKYSSNKKATHFEQLYKNDIDILTKPVYPQTEILRKAKTSVDYFYADALQQPHTNGNLSYQNNYMKAPNTNSPQSVNSRPLIGNNNDGRISNSNYTNTNPPQMNANHIERIDFNHPTYVNQTCQQYPFR